MKTGLFFGSFNPFHNGHLAIAQNFLDQSDLTHISFIVSPQNPLKKPGLLIDEQHRLQMTKLAIADINDLDVSDIEFSLLKPSYTINTLQLLKAKKPASQWVLLMGNDSLNDLPRWKDYKTILDNYEIYVYPRTDSPELIPIHRHIKIFNFPLVDISSTLVRQNIKMHFHIDELVPASVAEYISQHNLYLE